MRGGLTADRATGDGRTPLATRPVLLIAGGLGSVLLAVSWRYGYSTGELYLLAAGQRLDWGYADQPPLLPLLARLMDTLTGGSLGGLRLPATLVTSAGVLVTALIARELGGGRYAQILAASVYAGSFFVVGTGHLLAAPTIDAFGWAVCTWLLVRWVRIRDDRLLLWLGLVTAVAVQADYLIIGFWLMALIAVLTVGPRELASRPRLLVGGGFALLTAAPSALWQAGHGWPRLAAHRGMVAEQALLGGKATFLPLVLITAGLLAGAAGACYGVARLLAAEELRPYAFLGWTAIGVTALFLATGGRPYYVAGMFPVLWAAAAVEVERGRLPRWCRWIPSWPVLALSALLALPGMPVMPVSWLDGDRPVAAANPRLGEIGWPQLAASVADVYRGLPPQAQRGTAILTRNYWAAAAVDRFGPPLGLPPAHSGDRGYWYFGAPPESTDTVLYLGDPTPLRPYFGQLRLLGTTNPTTLGVRTLAGGTPIWLATGRRQPWSALWPAIRTPQS